MIKFAIRDDDISFWTKPEELESVYKEIWAKNIPVSVSVIPFAVRSLNCGDWDNFYQEEVQKGIGENKELLEFLKDKMKENKISIMLHGFSHQYKVAENRKAKPVLATKDNLDRLRKNKKGTELIWFGEYSWKSYEQLKRETKEGKEYLEDLFHTKIKVFVPPSNDISKDGVKAVSECGLDISGTMYLRKFNRPVNYLSVKNWFLKFWWRIRYNKVYPYVMDYGTHKELVAYGLIPQINFDWLNTQFKFCEELEAPFVLATHYWELLLNQEMHHNFKSFINSIKNRVCYSKIEDLLK